MYIESISFLKKFLIKDYLMCYKMCIDWLSFPRANFSWKEEREQNQIFIN